MSGPCRAPPGYALSERGLQYVSLPLFTKQIKRSLNTLDVRAMPCTTWQRIVHIVRKVRTVRFPPNHRAHIVAKATSGVHIFMRVKSAQTSEGGWCTPTPFNYCISTITYKVVVYTPTERANTLPYFSSTPPPPHKYSMLPPLP
jgi:hypothetical protein